MSFQTKKREIHKSKYSPRKWTQSFSTGSKSFLLIDSYLMFSQNFILAGRGHFEELQLKDDLSDLSQIWSVERL